jgi:hypothetical protein
MSGLFIVNPGEFDCYYFSLDQFKHFNLVVLSGLCEECAVLVFA